MKIIYDKDLIHIKVQNNNETLVNVKDISKDIKIDLQTESRRFFGKNICLLRKSVAMKLAHAQKNLKGVNIVICDGYRPIELQKKIYEKLYNKIKKKNPKWSEAEVEMKCSKFIAPVSEGIIPPHSTGGAVDITLEKSGKLIDMGTKLGELSVKSVTNSKMVSKKARENRKMLVRIMKKAGFINYPLEWWHWSYGDKTWAYYKNMKTSIYDSVVYR
jgi:D-alanyl-D-alanine dipeptidase